MPDELAVFPRGGPPGADDVALGRDREPGMALLAARSAAEASGRRLLEDVAAHGAPARGHA